MNNIVVYVLSFSYPHNLPDWSPSVWYSKCLMVKDLKTIVKQEGFVIGLIKLFDPHQWAPFYVPQQLLPEMFIHMHFTSLFCFSVLKLLGDHVPKCMYFSCISFYIILPTSFLLSLGHRWSSGLKCSLAVHSFSHCLGSNLTLQILIWESL